MPREVMGTYRITELPEDERPRERLAKAGAGALSKAELLAILLRVGMPGINSVQLGQQILDKLGGLAGIQRASLEEMCQIYGLGMAKAAQIKAAIELGSRMAKEQASESGPISSPQAAAELIQLEMQGLRQEQLRVILLDTRNKLLSVETVYVGSLNQSLVRVGEGVWSPDDLEAALKAADRRRCGPMAPACGLYLVGVDYRLDEAPAG